MKLKELLITTAKLSIAGLLIYWLKRSGQLDFSQLLKFIQEPSLIVVVLSYFIICPVILGTMRWKTLLEGADYHISWPRALRLQLTGFFFNTVMPGAVGGDIVKIAYVIRDNQGRSKTQAMMTVLLDRIVGLFALFFIGIVMAGFNYSDIKSHTNLQPLVLFMGTAALGCGLFFFAALYHYRGWDPFSQLLALPVPGLRLIEKLYNAVRIYRYARQSIILSIAISIVIQTSSLLLFYFLCTKVLAITPDFAPIATIFPVGILTTAIPITPGGLGVGHVAFERLFQMIGLDNGATVFNVYVLSQLTLNLLGVLAYLGLRRHPISDLEGGNLGQQPKSSTLDASQRLRVVDRSI